MRGRACVTLDAVEERSGFAALAVDNHNMGPLIEGRRRQARVVSRAGNGCDAATEAGVVQDDAAVIAAVVRANEPAKVVGDGEQFEPDRDGAIGHAGWADVDGQGRIFSATNAQCFDALDDSDGCAVLQCVPALVGGIIEIHFKRRRVGSKQHWQPLQRASDAQLLNARLGSRRCGRVERRAASEALGRVARHGIGR
eukprot:scaffold10401_cov65-Phaeocystis_antarctica.AAC.10